MADYSKLRGLLLAAAVVCIAVAMLLGWTPELDRPPHRYILVPHLTWTNRTWIFRLWVREKWVQPCTWLLVLVFDVFTYLWSSLLRLDAFFWARTIFQLFQRLCLSAVVDQTTENAWMRPLFNHKCELTMTRGSTSSAPRISRPLEDVQSILVDLLRHILLTYKV